MKESDAQNWWLIQQGRSLKQMGIENSEETLAIINNINWMIHNGWLSIEGATSMLGTITDKYTGEDYEH